MEINKILFEQLSQTKGINNPFEDFDVNNDGVINEKDAAAAVQNEALASQITNLLSSVDEDVELDDNAEFFENELQNISISKSGSSKTSEANAAANLIYESQIAENYGKHDIDDLLAAIPENLYYGFSGNFTTSYRSILSDPLFFLRITNDDIKKLSDTISSLNEKNTSGSKLYASALQNLLDSIEAQKSSYNSLQDELNGSSLASGKTIEINVFGGSVQSTNSSSVTVTNVNGSNVYNVKNGSDNVYFTDEDIDNLLNAINSTKTSKSYMEYIITGTLSQSSSLGEGGYIDETTWMKSNMKKLAESILGMKCTYQASSSKGESKFEWTNSLGQTSTFGSCMQCAASTGNFVNLLYKAVQARTILKNAQNSSTSELDGVTSPLKSGGNNADSSQVSNATASNSSTSVIALTQFEINNLNSKQEEIQEKI